MVSLGSNISSLVGQRALAKASDTLQRAYERLSSGQRINRASDDAAGMAVSSLLNSRARVFTQAIANVNDGISALAISDRALGSLGVLLTRQKELATQSANGVYTLEQRRAMQEESDALTDEYNRIVATTAFNGIKLLDGTNSSLRIQAGYGIDESLSAGTGQDILRTVGNGAFTAPINSPYLGYTQDFAMGDFNGDGTMDFVRGENESNYYVIDYVTAQGTFQGSVSFYSNGQGDRATSADVNGDGYWDVIGNGQVYLNNGNGTFAAGQALTGVGEAFTDINGDGNLDVVSVNTNVIYSQLGNGNGTFRAAVSSAAAGLSFGGFSWRGKLGDVNGDGIADLNLDATVALGRGDGTFATQTSLSFSGSPNSNSVLADFNHDGFDDVAIAAGSTLNILFSKGDGTFHPRTTLALSQTTYRLATADFNGDGLQDIAVSGASQISAYSFDASGTPTLLSQRSSNGSLVAADFNGDGVSDLAANNSSTGYISIYQGSTRQVASQAYLNLLSRTDALASLDMINDSFDSLLSEQGKLGAIQRRMDIAVAALRTSVEQHHASNSRIVDADIASEAALLTASKINQSIAAFVLAQANQAPALALTLL